jgi:hypothetical protein
VEAPPVHSLSCGEGLCSMRHNSYGCCVKDDGVVFNLTAIITRTCHTLAVLLGVALCLFRMLSPPLVVAVPHGVACAVELH